jgi:type IV secretion system protein VirB4
VVDLSARLRREARPDALLPYSHHLSEEVVALDGGGLMMSFRLEGASFETADIRDLNDWHAKLNGAWRNLADERLAVWHHLVRREDPQPPAGRFRSAFAATLDARHRARLAGERMFVNELYLTLVLQPPSRAVDRAGAAMDRLRRKPLNPPGPQDLEHLENLARDLKSHLARYSPRALGVYERDGLWFTEPGELLRLVLTGRPERVPLVRGHLGQAIYSARVIFGREALEVREPAAARFAGILGVKEYPATTRPGLWNGLLSARFPLIVSQSFAFLSKTSARTVLERKQNQMLSARDRALSQVSGLCDALDDLTSNRFVMGEHQASVLVQGETPQAMAENLSKARAVLADCGLVVAREDLALEAGFWAQFPGNFSKRTRPAAITSRNFAAFCSFHTHPSGRAKGNHWGDAVALLRTAAGSPFHFSFHVGDLGHTFICGPSGSGKTVIQNFMLAQLEKLGVQQVFIDKDRGAEIFVRACGGTYLTLRNGQPTGFAPLKALEFTPQNRSFLARWLKALVAGDQPLSASEDRALQQALDALAPLPAPQRSIAALRALLGQADASGLGARLERWVAGGSLGWVFDNPTDEIGLEARLIGFDMTEILDHAEVRRPAMMYIFHRIQALVDGRRLVIDIDEFWKALADESFRALAQDGLKTYRKQNAALVFGTQSPADVLRSPISHTILEQCATKIFLPNPHANPRDYVEGFGLTRRELELVRDELDPGSRRFLVKQGANSVVAELNLDGLDEELAVLSGRSESVEALDRLRAAHGDAPEAWLPHFRAQFGVGAS